MAKRGEVVDAETAEIICDTIARSRNPDIRPIIWPIKKAEDAIDVAIYNPRLIPLHLCQRPLCHLICLPDEILCLISSPQLFGDDESTYGLEIVEMTLPYDYQPDPKGLLHIQVHFGLLNHNAPNPLNNPACQKANEEGRFNVYWPQDIEKFMSSEIERGCYARAKILEHYAFSPHTTFKERSTLKHAISRNSASRQRPVIEIVNLRLPEKRDNPKSRDKEFSMRFFVKGHLRRQWRPSTKDHKLIWVEEHIRGPKDAPLKPKPTKVYKVTR